MTPLPEVPGRLSTPNSNESPTLSLANEEVLISEAADIILSDPVSTAPKDTIIDKNGRVTASTPTFSHANEEVLISEAADILLSDVASTVSLNQKDLQNETMVETPTRDVTRNPRTLVHQVSGVFSRPDSLVSPTLSPTNEEVLISEAADILLSDVVSTDQNNTVIDRNDRVETLTPTLSLANEEVLISEAADILLSDAVSTDQKDTLDDTVVEVSTPTRVGTRKPRTLVHQVSGVLSHPDSPTLSHANEEVLISEADDILLSDVVSMDQKDTVNVRNDKQTSTTTLPLFNEEVLESEATDILFSDAVGNDQKDTLIDHNDRVETSSPILSIASEEILISEAVSILLGSDVVSHVSTDSNATEIENG